MFLNARTVESENMPLSSAEFKNLDVLNAVVHTRLNIIVTLPSTAKQTSRLTSLVLKQSKESSVSIALNASTVRVNTKQTPIIVHSGSINSIRSGMSRSIRRTVKAETC